MNENKQFPELPRSGVSGVTYDRKTGRWRVQMVYNKKHYSLGGYKNLTKAVWARYRKEQELAGNQLYIGYSPAERYLRDKGLL